MSDRVSRGHSGARLLAGLLSLNVLSYLDRQMLAAVAPLLIAEFGLSRAQIGLLIGVAFITVFAAATVAMGLLADRVRRPRLIAGGLAVWSVATGFTATAGGFASLACWRSLVGIGEATLSPTALATIADRLPTARRGFANGVFYAGIPIGSALSYAVAAWLCPRFGWRAGFLVLGAAGLVAITVAWRLPDAPRTRALVDGAVSRGLAHVFARRPAILWLMIAGALLAYASASSQHVITWLVQERDFSYSHAAWLSAAVTATAGLAGNLGIGWATDRAGHGGSGRHLLAFAAIGTCAFAAAAAFYLLPVSSPLFLAAWVVAQAWMFGWYGPLFAAILGMVPVGRRATTAGVGLSVVNLLGVASGPWLTGVIGDRAGLTQGLLASLGMGAIGLGLVATVGWHLRSHPVEQ